MVRVASVLAVLSLLVASEARAQRFIYGGVLLGYGAEKEYGVGLGAKFDAALPFSATLIGAEGAHVGGRGVFHFGDTETVEINNIEGEVQTQIVYFSGELGLVWLLRNITVRPFGMIGAAAIITEGTASEGGFVLAGNSTEWKLLLAPGLLITIPLRQFMLEAEVDYFFVDQLESVVFYLAFGTKFGP